MPQQHWFDVVAGLLALMVIVGGLVALQWGATAPAASQPLASPAESYLYLTISFNPINGLDEYFPANFSVPTHTLVDVVVTNYDNGTNAPPPAFETVQGTVGGLAHVGGSGGTTASYSDLSADDTAHTFTLETSSYNLNVPIPPASATLGPAVISFAAFFNQTGEFTWHCFAPCDMMAMATPGFMEGTVTVLYA